MFLSESLAAHRVVINSAPLICLRVAGDLMISGSMDVLLVEDDLELVSHVVQSLSAEGHAVQAVHTGTAALEAAAQKSWDVIILDVALPRLNGFEVVTRLRAAANHTPVLFLSALGEVTHRIQGLSLGGDDYLTKPFSMDELKARLRVVDRREGRIRAPAVVLPADWQLDPLLREVRIQGERVSLQPREWSLLQLFLAHPGEVLTKTFLLDQAWGIHFDPGTNVVDAVICRLRRKLDQPGLTSHIVTVRGRGYRISR